MPALINLIGKQFARLTVLDRLENNQHNHTVWLCRCKCGNEKPIAGDYLRNGDTKSCGCLHPEAVKRERPLDYVGRRFGRLIILSRAKNKNRCSAWLCKCDCGKEKVIVFRSLMSGDSQSCGCFQKEELSRLASLRVGDKSPRWRGGITAERQRVQNTSKYKNWRTAVFTRDNFLCQECGAGGEIQAHHLHSFSAFPELRFEVSNGQTLCLPCHKKTPTYLRGKQKI